MEISHKTKMRQWEITRTANEYESNRLNYLRNTPLPVTPPELFRLVRCKVIKSFCVSGKPTQPGDVISLPLHEAMGLKAINKVLIIE